MEHLSEELIIEILKRITRTSDLNSLSLVSKQLYSIDAEQRATIRLDCGLATEAFPALCSRFPNLLKVEIDYSGWTSGNGSQIDNQCLLFFSSCCTLLNDLTLSFCSNISDPGIACLTYCKKLMSLRLNSIPELTSSGLLLLAVGCKALSSVYLNDCKGIAGSTEWLEHLGANGSLEELAADTYRYDLLCESLKDLRLAHLVTEPEGPEIGLRFLLGKCKALERLCLEYVSGLIDNDLIALSQTCKNLKSISLWLNPEHYNVGDDIVFRTGFTDGSLKALRMIKILGPPLDPPEIGFTQEGLVSLVQSCPIRVLMLNSALFNDDGMKALSTAQFLETLSLIDCDEVTDHGMRFAVHFPSLINLTLRYCYSVSDVGLSELVHAQKLESLVVGGCPMISEKGVQCAAKSVCYEVECQSLAHYKRLR
ncbi:F-box/LRR-repeat protein 14-like [Oryza glaberrima]|uniref:F-box/LRR-repeat protein 14-like n=1 Tax=Oryza glaberrima TaxID=4538 RepID=UPI00224C05BC|nr:F-box/LRR-repeat protein 14-like [Oryza glaberrima]